MARKHIIIIVLYGILYSSITYAEQQYVNGIEDLPVPDGFVEQKKYGLSYDTIGGRIVEAVYEGNAMLRDIKTYYEKTLPQLGWEKMSYRLYQRDNEELSINLSNEGQGEITIKFTLRPSKKPGFIHAE